MPLNLFADTTQESSPFADTTSDTGKITWDKNTQTTNTGATEEEYLATLTIDEQKEHYRTGQHNGTYNPWSSNPLYGANVPSGGGTSLVDLDPISGGNDHIGYSFSEGSLGSMLYQSGSTPARQQERWGTWEAWYDQQPEAVRRAATAGDMNFFPTKNDPHSGTEWSSREAAPFYNEFHKWFTWKVAQENDWALWEDKEVRGAEFTQIDSTGNKEDSGGDWMRMGTHDNNPDHDQAYLSLPFGLENATDIRTGNIDRPANADDIGLEGGYGSYDQLPNQPDNPDKTSSATRQAFWNNPVMKVIQTFAPPPIKLALAVLKETSNQDVSPMEWAGAALGALEVGGWVDPTAATTAEAGTGIGSMSYEQTEQLLNAAASDDVEDFVINQFEAELTDIAMDGLEAVGIDAETFGTDDATMRDNVGGIVTDWASEGSLEDAVVKNVGEDAVQVVADALPEIDLGIDIDTPEWVEGIGDAVVAGAEALAESPIGQAVEAGVGIADDALDALGETFEPVVDAADTALDAIGKVTDPFTSTIGDVGQDIIDTTSDVLSEAEDVVVDTAKAAEDFVEPAKDFVADTFEPVVDAADEFIDKVDSPIGDALGYGEDFLKWLAGGAVGAFGAGDGMMQVASAPTSTEKLFDKELFKFDDDIVKSAQQKMQTQDVQGYYEYNPLDEALKQFYQQEQKPRGFGLEVEPLGEYITVPRSYSF
jgi:hypothetical protein